MDMMLGYKAGAHIIESRWFRWDALYFVLDSRGDVYQYKPNGVPFTDLNVKARTGGNRGKNDAEPRIAAFKGGVEFLFNSNLRPIRRNETNMESPKNKHLEWRLGDEVAACFGGRYTPSTKSDGDLSWDFTMWRLRKDPNQISSSENRGIIRLTA